MNEDNNTRRNYIESENKQNIAYKVQNRSFYIGP